MKTAALLFMALFPLLAHAQHEGMKMPAPKGKPVVAAPKADPDKRGRNMVVVPEHGEDLDHAAMHALPVGAGAAPDGGAWLRIDVSGRYAVHNAKIMCGPDCAQQADGTFLLEGNRVYRVLPHKGPLIWTPPGGKQGQVPTANLIAPTDRVGDKR